MLNSSFSFLNLPDVCCFSLERNQGIVLLKLGPALTFLQSTKLFFREPEMFGCFVCHVTLDLGETGFSGLMELPPILFNTNFLALSSAACHAEFHLDIFHFRASNSVLISTQTNYVHLSGCWKNCFLYHYTFLLVLNFLIFPDLHLKKAKLLFFMFISKFPQYQASIQTIFSFWCLDLVMKTKTKDAFKTILKEQSQNVVILFLLDCFIVSIENHYYDPLCFLSCFK